MGWKETRYVTKEEAIDRIKGELETKKHRVVKGGIASLLEEFEDEKLFSDFLSEEEYQILIRDLNLLSDKSLEKLLQNVMEDDYNYSITEDGFNPSSYC